MHNIQAQGTGSPGSVPVFRFAKKKSSTKLLDEHLGNFPSQKRLHGQ